MSLNPRGEMFPIFLYRDLGTSPKKDIGIQKIKKPPFDLEVSVI